MTKYYKQGFVDKCAEQGINLKELSRAPYSNKNIAGQWLSQQGPAARSVFKTKKFIGKAWPFIVAPAVGISIVKAYKKYKEQ